MACNHPLMCFRTGCVTAKGKDAYVIGHTSDVIFRVDEAIKKGHEVDLQRCSWRVIGDYQYLVDPVPVPCRDCVGCRMDRAKEWRNRCVLESELYDNVWFITLTYADECLPVKDGQITLCPDDMTRFIKRLRKAKGKFRYFYCGEYGSLEKTARPHYHMILFGLSFPDLNAIGRNAFTSKELSRIWHHGIVSISRAEPATIAYTTGYVLKKQKDPLFSSYAVRPFIRMSTRPALGSHVLQNPAVKSSGKIYGNFNSNKWASLPSCYSKKLADLDPQWAAVRKIALADLGKANMNNKFAVYGSSSLESIGLSSDEVQLLKLDTKRSVKL